MMRRSTRSAALVLISWWWWLIRSEGEEEATKTAALFFNPDHRDVLCGKKRVASWKHMLEGRCILWCMNLPDELLTKGGTTRRRNEEMTILAKIRNLVNRTSWKYFAERDCRATSDVISSSLYRQRSNWYRSMLEALPYDLEHQANSRNSLQMAIVPRSLQCWGDLTR